MQHHLEIEDRADRQPWRTSFRTTVRCERAVLCLVLAVLLSSSVAYGQSSAASITPIAGSPNSAYVNNVFAGQVFQQRGDGSANVATNFNFDPLNPGYQDSPALRVQGKPFSLAFWYRSTQTGPFRLLWENGEVFANTGYVVGLHNGYMAIEELNGDPTCPFTPTPTHTDWLHGSTATNDGNWHHAAFVADRDNAAGADTAHTYVYKDGVLDGTLPYCDPADNTLNSSNHWYGIGRNSPEFDYAGDVDHFTTWVGVALSEDEVNDHMNGGTPHYSNVGVWYEFENADGQRVPDLGPNHYDGRVSPDTTPLVGPGPAFEALVQDDAGNPVSNLEVSFTAPEYGASGTFTGGLHVATATTDASGIAIPPTFTANGIAGLYSVKAGVAGVWPRAHFWLRNLRYPTTTTIAASPMTSIFGDPVTFTATVTSSGGPLPTGTVKFRKGPHVLGIGTLDGAGQATFTTSTLPAGNDNVFAVYGGDSNSSKSTSTSVTVVVTRRPTTTVVVSSPNPSLVWHRVTFTVTVSSPLGGPTSGIVVLEDGHRPLAFAFLNGSGQAVFSIAGLRIGQHSITARYNGDDGHASSSSAPVTQIVH
jgi:hypothetical protein